MTAPQGSRYVGPYTVLHSKPVYENLWMKVREDRVTRRGTGEATFGIVTLKPGVTVLPIDEDGNVTLVREFKYGIGERSLEAVSGAIESGEDAARAGLRELAEEVGLVASEWVDMGLVNPFTTVVNSPNHMFLARGLSRTRRAPDAGEQIETIEMPLAEALRGVLDGTITHSASCVVILKAHLFLERLSRR